METPAPPPPPGIQDSPATRPRISRAPMIVVGTTLALPGILGLTGNADLAAIGAFLLAPLGALISGIFLGIRLGQTPGTRFLLSCVLIVACLAVAEGIAVGGCALGNPKFNVH